MNNINIDKVIIRFIGDSGDGIQLVGNQITNTSVIVSKNDIYTFVEYPPEIRAPTSSLSGVSSFQLSISKYKLYCVEDKVDVLIAFNPAALKVGLPSLKKKGLLIIDINSFTKKNLCKAKINFDILESELLFDFTVLKIPISKLTCDSVKSNLNSIPKAKRCKNFFALGIIYWIYDRNLENTLNFLKLKFKDVNIFEANKKSLISGYNYARTMEFFKNRYHILPFDYYNSNTNLEKISGNKAFVIGALCISFINNLTLFSANYPITPASEILHILCKYSSYGVKVIQMEDEIAAITASIGASYGGVLSFTCTSGPGLDLMQEGIGLAVMSELPVVILNIQRSGPSTGIPTRSEQTDLLSSIFGRHGESHVVVLAPNSPVDCFYTIIEAFYISTKFLLPVIVLSDSNLANSTQLFKIPTLNELYNIKFIKLDKHFLNKNVIGSPIGGLERDICTNEVSYDPDNHFLMIKKRYKKLISVSEYIGDIYPIGCISGKLLLISWGSVSGVVRGIYESLYKYKNIVAFLSLKYLNPLPKNISSIIVKFDKIVVIEENLGQLSFILKSKCIKNISSIFQVTGKPFSFNFLKNKIMKYI